ncbi:MAG: DNA-binding protein WhiA, partial [Clostridia bacterium]|nr:DNA-binding protein WhiA [Clostridia bacterium]
MLAAIGAHLKMMEFVNVVIEKDIRNITNRRVNFEIANIRKTNDTAINQQYAIKKILLEHGWQSMSPELAEVAKIRLEDSYISLAGIAQKLGISKSGVNHRMRRIMELAEMDK